MTTSAEEKFLVDLETFRVEAQSAAQSLYAFLTMHATIADSRPVRNAVNENSLFWRTCLASLQTTYFIILGRIFDTNSKHNLFALLTHAKNNSVIFSLGALEARKRAQSPNADEWIAEYLASAYVPTDKDFNRLRKRARHYEHLYKKNYKRIRNKIFAHKEVTDDASVQSLFANTRIRDLENTIVYLNKLHECFWQLLYNGREPRLPTMPYSVRNIRRRPLPDYHFGTVQQQIVKEADRTLRLLGK